MNTTPERWVWFLDDDLVQSLLAADPDHPQLNKRAAAHPAVVEAVSMQLAGNSAAAKEVLRPALMIGNPDALLLAGQIAFEGGQMEEASSHYRRLADLRPDHPYASLNAGLCLARLRRWRMAIESLQRAVVLDPDRSQAWFVLGVCLLNERRAAEARSSFARSLRLREDYAPAWFGQAAALQLEGKHGDALAIYERLATVQPRNPEILENALSSAWELRDKERVRHYAERLSQAAPQSAHALWAQLVLAVEDAQYGTASKFATAIAEANPNSPLDWYNLSVCLQKAGRHVDAITALQNVVRLSPEDADAWCDIGNAYWSEGQTHKAEQAYEKALSLLATHQAARRGLVALAIERGDAERAAEWRDGIEDPEGQIAYALGVLRHRRGELEQAARLYREALTQQPERAECQWNLGHLLFALNRIPEARDHWRAALEAKPELALAALR